MDNKSTWREIIEATLYGNKDNTPVADQIEAICISTNECEGYREPMSYTDPSIQSILDKPLNIDFDAFGNKVIDFMFWTKEDVYFLDDYDGKLFMRSCPRNPITVYLCETCSR